MKRVDKRTLVPGLVVRGGGDSTTREYCLGLQEHFLPGREDGAIGDHEVLGYMRIRYDDEKLITEP